MTEVLFYHLQDMTLESVLPPLLEKSLERGWRVVVQSTSQERADALDAHLWTYRDDSFLPHATWRAGDAADQPILLATGPEPIAGSTRMNAGTAQRITLNLLSTLVMIRLGRIYRGMMVEVQASNAKLAKRREKILAHLTGQNGKQVRDALRRSSGSVKLALLLLQGCDLHDAEAVLERVGGRLRVAIDHLAKANPASLRSKEDTGV